MKKYSIPTFKLSKVTYNYIYEILKNYGYNFESNYHKKAKSCLDSGKSYYIVINYMGHLGYVDITDSKGTKTCNRSIIQNLDAFLDIARQMKCGSSKYCVKRQDLTGDLKNISLIDAQKLIDYQYEQKGYSCISLFQKYHQGDNVWFGVNFFETKEGSNYWRENYVFRTESYNYSDKMPQVSNNLNSKGFQLSDIKLNMVIECVSGHRFLIIQGGNGKSMFAIGGDYSWMSMGSFNEDLTDRIHKDFDIVKVYKFKKSFTGTNLHSILHDKKYLDLIWERPKTVELTKQQIIEKFNLNIHPNELIIKG